MRSESGRAIRRSRRVSRGSRPSTPPGTSVASVNSRIGCVGEQQDREDHLDDLLGGLELDVEDEHGVLPRGEDDGAPRRPGVEDWTAG
jgi:hypothetical protein